MHTRRSGKETSSKQRKARVVTRNRKAPTEAPLSLTCAAGLGLCVTVCWSLMYLIEWWDPLEIKGARTACQDTVMTISNDLASCPHPRHVGAIVYTTPRGDALPWPVYVCRCVSIPPNQPSMVISDIPINPEPPRPGETRL